MEAWKKNIHEFICVEFHKFGTCYKCIESMIRCGRTMDSYHFFDDVDDDDVGGGGDDGVR